MPQFPESVTIVCSEDGAVGGIEIDGAEFPWFLDEGGVSISFEDLGLARVNLSIIVDADRVSTRRKES